MIAREKNDRCGESMIGSSENYDTDACKSKMRCKILFLGDTGQVQMIYGEMAETAAMEAQSLASDGVLIKISSKCKYLIH